MSKKTNKFKRHKPYQTGAPILATRVDDDVFDFLQGRKQLNGGVRSYIESLVRNDVLFGGGNQNTENYSFVGNLVYHGTTPMCLMLKCPKCAGSIMVKIQEKAPLGVGCECRNIMTIDPEMRNFIEGVWRSR